MPILLPLLLPLVLGQTLPSDPFVRTRPPEAGGHCLRWTRDTVVWTMDRTGNADTPGDTEFDAIRRSFAAWQAIFDQCGNLDLVQGGENGLVDDRNIGFVQGGTNRNVVLFRTARCGAVSDGDCWSGDDQTIAITLTTFNPTTGALLDADIELNAAPQRDGRRFVFTTSQVPSCSAAQTPVAPTPGGPCILTDLQNTVTHEVGHFLGLDHTAAPGSVMAVSAAQGDVSKREVDPGSADFICTAYPQGRPSQDCIAGGGNGDGNGGNGGSSGGGCAGGGMAPAAGLGALLLAAWASRRSRRGPPRPR